MSRELITPTTAMEKTIGPFDCGVYVFQDGTRVLSATLQASSGHILSVAEEDGTPIPKPQPQEYSFTDRVASLAVQEWEDTGRLPEF